jgi:demethylmenaquinone methyltransferase / 2-methoxy-6-polyprenyl-1,4-benzoquinol methylase
MPAQQGAGAATGPSGGDGAPQTERPSRPQEPARPPSPAQGSQAGRLEAAQVRAMFDGIAGVYDLLNTAMTAGLHHRWRRRAADLAHVGPGSRVLDVATGTGDLAIELAGRVAPGGEVIASDFSEGMLALARKKASRAAGAVVRFEWADALELPYNDDAFDAATVGFGARNFSDLARGLAEMVRVVRPGGRVVVLEITTPTRPPLSLFYAVWFDRIVPALGRVAQLAGRVLRSLRRSSSAGESGSADESFAGATIADAYTYLPNSVKRFPEPDQLAAELQRAGLVEIGYVLLAGGIVAIHTGTVGGGRG